MCVRDVHVGRMLSFYFNNDELLVYQRDILTVVLLDILVEYVYTIHVHLLLIVSICGVIVSAYTRTHLETLSRPVAAVSVCYM